MSGQSSVTRYMTDERLEASLVISPDSLQSPDLLTEVKVVAPSSASQDAVTEDSDTSLVL